MYFCEKKAEVLSNHAEEKWLCRISSFHEKRKTKQIKQNFFKLVATYWLRNVNCLHSSSIYPQESANKTAKGRKSRVKIRATRAS